MSTTGSVTQDPRLVGNGWVWPLPLLEPQWARTWGCSRAPVISDGFGEGKRDGGKRAHVGVDLMYKRDKTISKVQALADPYGTRQFVVPPGTEVRAAHRGRIWSAGKISVGHFVILDHGPELPFATYYTHMSDLKVPRVGPSTGNRNQIIVEAGQPLGTCGASPVDPERVVHLHFEVRLGMKRIDPGPLLKTWSYVT